MKKLAKALIILTIAALTIFWSAGVATDLFTSSAFSSFWWLSYEWAHYAQFTTLAIGGAILIVGIVFFVERNERKPVRLPYEQSKNKTEST